MSDSNGQHDEHIAAILTAAMVQVDGDVAVKRVVDVYERVLKELRDRRAGN